MTWGMVAIAGSSLISGAIGSSAASKASKAQTQAAAQSDALQREMFNKQVELQAPFREAGLTAQNKLLSMLGLSGAPGEAGYGKYAGDFTMQDFTTDPGYAFRLAEGNKALDRTAAARGGLLSGGAMKAAQRYGQEMGSQEYMNAFNRYQTNRANQLNPLQSLMGAGQSAANTLTTAAGQLGSDLGQNTMGAGNARASGYIGQANALTGALNQGVNTYMGTQYLNRMTPKPNLSNFAFGSYGGPGG